MAGPHVVGVVALLWQAVPALNRDIAGTKARLSSTANPNITVPNGDAVRRHRLDPEQPLRARPRRLARGCSRRRAASATSASTTAARRVDERRPAAAVSVRRRSGDRRHLRLRVRGLPLPGGARLDLEHGLPLQHRDRHVDDALDLGADAAGGAHGFGRLLPADEQDLCLRRLDAGRRTRSWSTT